MALMLAAEVMLGGLAGKLKMNALENAVPV